MSDAVIISFIGSFTSIITAMLVALINSRVKKLDTKIETVAKQTDGKITELIEIHKIASKAEGLKEGKIEGREEGLILGNLQGKVEGLITPSPAEKVPPSSKGIVIAGEIEGPVKITEKNA